MTHQQSTSRDRWNTPLYESKHEFVWRYGSELIELLAPQPSERILDLGCGTGQLTQQIAAAGAIAIGIDHSPSAIARLKIIYRFFLKSPDPPLTVVGIAHLSFSSRHSPINGNSHPTMI